MNREQFFMITAINLGKLSKCVSKKVGAIIVKNNRIISMGYNGTPRGVKNCCEIFDEANFDRQAHHEWSRNSEIHAEMNAIIFAAKNGISIDGAEMYVSLEPCRDCIKNICQAGITKIYWNQRYDKNEGLSEAVRDFITENSMKIEQLDV